MIKVFFCCSWDSDPVHFLINKYAVLTPNNSCTWKNIKATTNINDANWIVVVDDIHRSQLTQICNFDKTKVICLPREPARKNPSYLKYNFKYKMTYGNFYHVWTSIMGIKKTYDELMSVTESPLKNKLCSTITSRLNQNTGIYGKRIDFIKKLSQQKQFIGRVDIYGYDWTREELGDMYKGMFGGFNLGTCKSIDSLIPNSTKWDGLEHYSYSIAIENDCKENYFSEKFSDCILSWTIPIYYGCPNIGKYFPKDCYYWLDITKPDCFERLDYILKQPITEKQINAVREARDIILNKQNIWNVVSDIINNDV